MRWLLLPFSLIYWIITSVRNFFYDRGLLKSFEFDFPIILVGNISTGGTGKTPHVEYLVQLLAGKFKTGTLSRGYKRKLKGYALSTELSLVEDIGDEAKQIKQKFPEVEVAVSADRVTGVYYLLNDEPEVKVILMDDGFQHRRIKPGLQIILTPYADLFCDDFILPVGNLREPMSAKNRANIIIVTKCPQDLNEQSAKSIRNKINIRARQKLFFTAIYYGEIKPLFPEQEKIKFDASGKYVLITGIAKNQEIKNYISGKCDLIRSVSFGDHHYFSEGDIYRMGRETKNIVTTEKDAMRLMEKKEAVLNNGLSVFVVPVEISFLFGGKSEFDSDVINYINGYQTSEN